MRLDRLDTQLVALLTGDARRSYADLGAQVGLTASAVKGRVDRLREGGAITAFTVALDPAALGWAVEGYVELYCRSSTAPEVILAAVEGFAEVVEASTISGEADAMLHILATDMRHFESVLEQIGSQPFVARTKSVLVLSPLIRRPARPAGED